MQAVRVVKHVLRPSKYRMVAAETMRNLPKILASWPYRRQLPVSPVWGLHLGQLVPARCSLCVRQILIAKLDPSCDNLHVQAANLPRRTATPDLTTPKAACEVIV